MLEIHELSPIPGHLWTKTDDNSWTLFSESFKENCHSVFGAKEETLAIYLKALKVREKLLQKEKEGLPLNILEVGLGAGISLEMTLDLFLKLSQTAENIALNFVSLEIDSALIDYNIKRLPLLKNIYKLGNDYYLCHRNLSLLIVAGDARERILEFSANPLFASFMPFDLIYQDAFSPKNNGHLWTKEWFDQILKLSSKRCVLSTYSASMKIRRSMLQAGWLVEDCPGFGQKNSHTKAYRHTLDIEGDPLLQKKLQDTLNKNPHLALRDEGINNEL